MNIWTVLAGVLGGCIGTVVMNSFFCWRRRRERERQAREAGAPIIPEVRCHHGAALGECTPCYRRRRKFLFWDQRARKQRGAP